LRVRQVREAVDAARADSELCAELERIRLEQAAVKEGHYDQARAAPRYAAVLRGYGVDPAAPAEAAARVAGRRLRGGAVAAPGGAAGGAGGLAAGHAGRGGAPTAGGGAASGGAGAGRLPGAVAGGHPARGRRGAGADGRRAGGAGPADGGRSESGAGPAQREG